MHGLVPSKPRPVSLCCSLLLSRGEDLGPPSSCPPFLALRPRLSSLLSGKLYPHFSLSFLLNPKGHRGWEAGEVSLGFVPAFCCFAPKLERSSPPPPPPPSLQPQPSILLLLRLRNAITFIVPVLKLVRFHPACCHQVPSVSLLLCQREGPERLSKCRLCPDETKSLGRTSGLNLALACSSGAGPEPVS